MKSDRLIELDAALNIDRGPDEQAIAKSPRPSVLGKLSRPLPPPKAKTEKPKHRQKER